MTSIADHIAPFADALSLRERRNGILASNIANAATPNYKARDFDFEAAYAADRGMGAGLMRSDPRHFGTGPSGQATLGYRVAVNPSLDGNTVEAAVEQMEFAENSLRYQTSLMFLNRRISGLMTAMRGE
jgi:flagellar basal-body rod protein FlgB